MKIIYATDLDNTLIYSHNFLRERKIPLADVECIEQYQGKDINFIHNKVSARLKVITDEPGLLFLPVTTRRTEQYKRINLGISPEYAIVANGGVILHNGVPLFEWTNYIMQSFSLKELHEIISICKKFDTISHEPTICDSCFIFLKLEDPSEFTAQIPWFERIFPGWIFVQYSKKCYAFPKICSKGNALVWLAERLGYECIVASGDSCLDVPMLNAADLAVVPTHSDLRSSIYTYVDGGILSPLYTMDLLYTIKEEK